MNQAATAAFKRVTWWVSVGGLIQPITFPGWFQLPSEAWLGPYNPAHPEMDTVAGWRARGLSEVEEEET